MAKLSPNRTCAVCGGSLAGCSKTSKICGKPACVRERNRRKAVKFGLVNLWGRWKKCSWCREDFRRSQHRKKYCKDLCAKEAGRAAARARPHKKRRKS